MIRLSLLCALFVTLTYANNKFEEKIVGGQRADIEDFPYQVSLQLWNDHNCGGAIVSKRQIITAAHCTYGWENVDEDDVTIRAGSSKHKSGGQVIPVVEILEHPLYNDDNSDYDIAILTLLFDLEFNEHVQSIPIATTTPTKGMTVASGWGTTKDGGDDATAYLRSVELPLISKSLCKKLLNQYEVTENMICAGYLEGGKDACQGDSGGPLVLNGELVGIISWGIGCGLAKHPGVFTDVTKLLSTNISFK